MLKPHRILRAALVSFVSLTALRLPAAEKIDLERIVPVPADQPIPLQDFFRPLLLQQPVINPSGTHIAAIITAGEDRHQLLVYDLKTQKPETVGGMGDKDIYSVHWLNDRRVIFGLSSKKLYGLGLLAGNVGDLAHSYPLLQYSGSRLISVPAKTPLRPLVWNRYDSLETERDLGVAVVDSDLSSGKLINLLSANNDLIYMMLLREARDNNDRHIVKQFSQPGPGIVYYYETDREGQLEFGFTSENGNRALHRLVDGHWKKTPVDLEEVDVVDSGEQPGQLVVVGPRQDDKPRALQFQDATTGQLGDVLIQDKGYDFSGRIYRDPTSRAIVGAVYQRNGPQVVWFDEGYRNLQKILDGFFPGVVVRIIGSDDGGKIFLVLTYSDRQPVAYNWVNLQERNVGLIKRSAPWIDSQRMLPMNIIKFKTRDGRQLDAYLTLPAGASKKNPPPLVVLPHGGPWARDTWGFSGEVQFLASRGYAVLQPNYRGSTGYDWLFPVEDRWDFRKMHDDVTDATKAMIASGLIDGGRIAIMGTSFGGYLAVSGVVNEQALYRCAVTIAGVFDWEQQLKNEKYYQYDSPFYHNMLRRLGDPKKLQDKYDSFSPGRHVDQIRVPVFVAGGKDDFTVDIEQSFALISALEKHHVPYEKLLVREEGHGMGHLKNEVELYSRIEAFLAKNLSPKNTAASP